MPPNDYNSPLQLAGLEEKSCLLVLAEDISILAVDDDGDGRGGEDTLFRYKNSYKAGWRYVIHQTHNIEVLGVSPVRQHPTVLM